jgi:hypothetical protein
MKNEMLLNKEYSITFHFFRPSSTALLQHQIKGLVRFIKKKEEYIKSLTDTIFKNSIENMYEEKFKGMGYQDISCKEEQKRQEDQIFEMQIILENKMNRIIDLENMLNDIKKIEDEKKYKSSGLIIAKFLYKKFKKSKTSISSSISMKDLIFHSRNNRSLSCSGIRSYFNMKDTYRERNMKKQYNIHANMEATLEDYFY